MMKTCQDMMKSSELSPGSENVSQNNTRDEENQFEVAHNRSLLITDPVQPCRRTRAVVKEWLLKLRCCLGAACGMEWFAYAALGIFTAILSFLMDLSVTKLLRAHQWLYANLEGHTSLQFFCWTLYPACLCAVASSFCHNICPSSTGSGIPEVRTMLAGFELPPYLSLTNMFIKFLGLTCTLAAGSTVFLGKVGPFVHISTMVGAYLGKLCTLIQANKEDAAAGQMLVVAAAVGVSSCFGAPVSGVLFSVEVMSSHFALKHYCPCFFSAACGALTFRLLSVWSGDMETLRALFKTNFSTDFPFCPLEILLFAVLGVFCGAVSCCYLFCHRWILRFTKTNQIFIKILTTEKVLYSSMVAFLLATLTFPKSVGQYMASQLTMRQLLTSLLDNSQWSAPPQNTSLQPLLEWSSPGSPVYLPLAVFLLMKMWMLVLACTLPLPAGYFMPAFIYGAALGRLLGEGVAYVTPGQKWDMRLNPGGYALVGAAAFSGAVTHTLSPALLAVELTGQFSHAVPVLLATLLANGVARARQRPSFYDAISISKALPHLPSLAKACPSLLFTPVGELLRPQSVQLQKAAALQEIQRAVSSSTEAQIPVVDSNESGNLLGFALRSDLLNFLHQKKIESHVKHLDEVCTLFPLPVLLSPAITVQEAFEILTLVGAKTLFVADRGRLVGLITWSELKRIIEELAKEI
ncbi:chloride channel K isoform X1 [Takifugu rubripes]|uniref:Chloride channel protein n=2 Tax=Takifugu rubripes TaxID=31033 RepID=A0A674NL66_TAKRU|nr:chloride channel protein ClC-Kb isoform X1 [Takifugu rubripes]